MSWEAFRLTSRSALELMDVMGPNGVDGLIRECLMSCWRDLPAERRDFANWKKRSDEVFARNMKVWASIKKPSPEAFFANLLPYPADGHLRQAMVLCHMMLPRGKRPLLDVRKLITKLYERNVDAWTTDYRTFSHGLVERKKAKSSVKAAKKPKQKKSTTHRKK
jgi:hypothetical protein